MALKLELAPEKALIVRRGRTIVAASWFGPYIRRPYIYPFLGPGARELTRLDHPQDPVSHSHHKSIWISHHDAGGVNFWADSPDSGRIVQEKAELKVKEGGEVRAILSLSWRDARGQEILTERRSLAFFDLPAEELAMEIDVELRPAGEGPVVLGQTNFGLLGIRVARTLRVHERLGGLIFNSQEGENEAGCFGQHALWCDYSGPVPDASTAGDGQAAKEANAIPARIVGICCLDHPSNSTDGTQWHVRDDGWMGPGITRSAPRTVRRDEPLRARYRIESHAGRPWQADVDGRYRAWRRKVIGP